MNLLILLLSLSLFCAPQEQPKDASNGKTLVVFYRPSKHKGRASTPSVFIDGTELARIDNGRFFSIYLKPGEYLVQGLNSMHGGGIVTKFSVGDSPVYIEADASTHRDIHFQVSEPDAAIEKLQDLKPLDKKWIRDPRVVFDLPAVSSAASAVHS